MICFWWTLLTQQLMVKQRGLPRVNFAKEKVLVPLLYQQSCLAENTWHTRITGSSAALRKRLYLQLLHCHLNLCNMIVWYSDMRHCPGNLLASSQWKVISDSQPRERAAVHAKQPIKLTFTLSWEIGPSIIKQHLILYLFSGKEGGVAHCYAHN